MQWLPTLITPHGDFELPLSGHTAGRLVSALLRGQDFRCDEALLGEALAADPALALWGFLRAEQVAAGTIQDLPQLTHWLAGTLLTELGRPDEPSEPEDQRAAKPRPRPVPRSAQIEAWGDLFGRSLGVAMLAAEIAPSENWTKARPGCWDRCTWRPIGWLSLLVVPRSRPPATLCPPG